MRRDCTLQVMLLWCFLCESEYLMCCLFHWLLFIWRNSFSLQPSVVCLQPSFVTACPFIFSFPLNERAFNPAFGSGKWLVYICRTGFSILWCVARRMGQRVGGRVRESESRKLNWEGGQLGARGEWGQTLPTSVCMWGCMWVFSSNCTRYCRTRHLPTCLH